MHVRTSAFPLKALTFEYVQHVNELLPQRLAEGDETIEHARTSDV